METLMAEEVRTIEDPRIEILVVKWSNDDKILAVSCSDGIIKTFSTTTFRIKRVISIRTLTTMPYTGLSWKPQLSGPEEYTLLGVSSDGYLVVWNAETSKTLRCGHIVGEQGLCCEFSPNAQIIAIGTNWFEIVFHNATTLEFMFKTSPANDLIQGHTNRVYALKWISNKYLLSGGWDDSIFMWDIDAQEVLRAFYSAHICGHTIDLIDNLVLAGSCDREDQVKVYNYHSNQVVYSLTLKNSKNQISKIFGCQYSKAQPGQFLIAVGDTIKVVDTSDYSVVHNEEFESYWFCCDWANREDMFAVGNSEGTLKIYNLFLTMQT